MDLGDEQKNFTEIVGKRKEFLTDMHRQTSWAVYLWVEASRNTLSRRNSYYIQFDRKTIRACCRYSRRYDFQINLKRKKRRFIIISHDEGLEIA